MDIQFSVQSDLYKAGMTEDGEDYIAEGYFLRAEDADGNRWAYPAFFQGCKVAQYDDGDGTGFEDVRQAAKAHVYDMLTAILHMDGVVDLRDWNVVDPAYGSKAYQASNTEAEQLARERLDS